MFEYSLLNFMKPLLISFKFLLNFPDLLVEKIAMLLVILFNLYNCIIVIKVTYAKKNPLNS